MRIRCPECHFERDIDTTKIPATATVAACPKCGTRFRFRDPQSGQPLADQGDGEPADAARKVAPDAPQATPGQAASSAPDSAAPAPDAPPVPHLPTEEDGDDPLPPGAVIPTLDEEHGAAAPGRETAEPSRDSAPDFPQNGTPAAGKDGPKRRLWSGLKKDARPRQPEHSGNEPQFPLRDEPDAGEQGKPSTAPSREEEDDDGVPWEQPERYGFFPSFYQTILRVMFRPQEFFSRLRGVSPNSSLMRPACFYVLLSFFQTVVGLLWTMNSFKQLSQTTTDPQTLAHINIFMQGMSTPLLLLVTPFIMLLQLFLFAAFYHLMIRLAQPDKADFNTVVRVIAYSAAPLIISVVPVAGSSVASFWFVASTFIGCKYALDLSWSKTTLALVPLFLLALAVMLALFQAALMLASGS